MEHMIILKEQAYIMKEYIILDGQYRVQLTAKSKDNDFLITLICPSSKLKAMKSKHKS